MSTATGNLWARLPNETEKAYRAFSAFLDAGPLREKIAIYRQLYGTPEAKSPAGYFSAWAKRFKWDERARAYDAHMDQIEREAREKAAAKAAAGREKERQKEIIEKGWELGQKIIQRVQEMLAAPVFRIDRNLSTETSDDGKTTTVNQQIIMPVNWRARDIATLAKVAVELSRLSADLPISSARIEVDIERVARELGITPEELLAEADEIKTSIGIIGTNG